MSDRTKDTFVAMMESTFDHAPAAPALPTVEGSRRVRRPVLALASGFAVATIAVGMTILAATDDSRTTQNVSAGDTSSTSSTVALAVTINPQWLTVESDDLDAYNQIPLPGSGERAPLRSETIWCFYQSSRPIEAHVVGLNVDAPLTTAALKATCATHSDLESDAIPASMTVCRGTIDDAAYQDWTLTGNMEMETVSGNITDPRPGFPVILGWQSDCVSETLTSNPPISLTADLSLDAIDEARRLDLAIIGAATNNCLTLDQADAFAAAVVDKLGQGWLQTSLANLQPQANTCYSPFIDQQWGWVSVGIVRGGGNYDDSVATTTLAPTEAP